MCPHSPHTNPNVLGIYILPKSVGTRTTSHGGEFDCPNKSVVIIVSLIHTTYSLEILWKYFV